MWNKTFKLIERALGFKLHGWQKAYISMESDYVPDERGCGSTTAFILRWLLNYGEKLGSYEIIGVQSVEYWRAFPCDRDGDSANYKYGLYPKYVIELDYKLQMAGVDTCFE